MVELFFAHIIIIIVYMNPKKTENMEILALSTLYFPLLFCP